MPELIERVGLLLAAGGLGLMAAGAWGLLRAWRAGEIKWEVIPEEEVERIFDLEDDDGEV